MVTAYGRKTEAAGQIVNQGAESELRQWEEGSTWSGKESTHSWVAIEVQALRSKVILLYI